MAVSPDNVRAFHQKFVAGVTIVTTLTPNGVPKGLVVNAFSSISLDPPLVLACVGRGSGAFPWLFRSDHFAVSILAADQWRLVKVFSTPGIDKFAGVGWERAPQGSPIIMGCCAWIEAEIKDRAQAVTHTVFIGEVTSVEHSAKPPVIYVGGHCYDGGHLDRCAIVEE